MKIQSADQYYILTLSRGTREYTRKRFSMVLKSTWGSITCNQRGLSPPNKREEEIIPVANGNRRPFILFAAFFRWGKYFSPGIARSGRCTRNWEALRGPHSVTMVDTLGFGIYYGDGGRAPLSIVKIFSFISSLYR